MFGLKKFRPGMLRVQKVWAQNIFIDFLTEQDNFKTHGYGWGLETLACLKTQSAFEDKDLTGNF